MAGRDTAAPAMLSLAREPLPQRLQRILGRLLAPLWLPLLVLVMRVGYGWTIRGAEDARREFRRLRSQSRAPLLICANHLTMVDSALIAWALGAPWWYVRHYAALPWNLPERTNFADSWWQRLLVPLMKCLPITRDGPRGDVAAVLSRFTALLAHGEVGLIFPEGGRSRSGRVERSAATYGVGRIVRALPGCRVLCVYLRGEHQTTWSARPIRGERFRVSVASLEPRATAPGLRGSLAIAEQVLTASPSWSTDT